MTTNFQKKESNTKYVAISFEKSSGNAQTPVKLNSDPYNDETSEVQSEQMPPGDRFGPMSSDEFMSEFRHVMLIEEIEELVNFPIIYYAGSIPDRLPEDLALIKEINLERIETFNQKKAEAEDAANGEFQGNPIFDNFEGYFKVEIGEQIAYRYEIMSVLGKGSFA